MNSKISNKITNQTTQILANGTTLSLVFHYPANFKIGDTIEVVAAKEVMQLLVPQHEEGCYGFDVTIWDDQIRLYCDSKKELRTVNEMETVFSFKIREIELFANSFSTARKVALSN